MPLSAKQTAAGVVVVGAIIAGSWALRSQLAEKRHDDMTTAPASSEIGDVRTDRIGVRRPANSVGQSSARKRQQREAITSGVTMLSAGAPAENVLPHLSGYVVDKFTIWTSIPDSYISDNMAIRDGHITLADDPGSTAPRSGQLVSPPLPLRSPALAAPAASARQLPPDASLMLELSLSDDGITWSPWVAVEKYVPPDGKRVTPPLQASISEQQLTAEASAATTAPLAGPSLRYRLTLSAGNSPSPALADIRIWKRELP